MIKIFATFQLINLYSECEDSYKFNGYNYHDFFEKYMTGDAISDHLKILTKNPHTAGTDEDEIVLVNYLREEMERSFLKGGFSNAP